MKWQLPLLVYLCYFNMICCWSGREPGVYDKHCSKMMKSLKLIESCEMGRMNDRRTWINTLEAIQSQLAEVLTENKQIKTDIDSLKRKTNDLERDKNFLQTEIERISRGDDVLVKKPSVNSMTANTDRTQTRRFENFTKPNYVPVTSMKTDASVNSASSIPRARRFENDLVVAFYAVITNHLEHVGAKQNIVFNLAITNEGNAYNIYAGDFRAPVAGTYSFSTTLREHGTSQLTQYCIAKNNDHVGNLALMGNIEPFSSYALTVVLKLNQGDTISVRNLDTDTQLNGNYYSVFSGFLLQEDYTGPTIVG